MQEIKHRWSGATIASGVTIHKAAESAKAYLRGADLSHADLSGAYLRGADLSGAYLRHADLSGAYLSGANLRGAILRHANLRHANLRGANLRGANLRHANLRGANLSGANLRGAYLSGADLCGANLRGAYLSGATVPTIPSIDHAILTAIRAPGHSLEMDSFHSCETTHCRAGWAIHLAGKAGYDLEQKIGSCAAGALIYAASRPDQPVPDFYASNGESLADIECCAATQS